MSICMVWCNVPDIDLAESLAKHLVERKLAACVNILFPCRSIYRWEDRIENTQEIPMLIKTTHEAFDDLSDAICERHPYEVPEIIAFDCPQALASYAQWVNLNVCSTP